MNCDQVQREIVVPSDPRDWRDSLRQARALRHVADCPHCAAFAARLHQLDAQIETWKSDTNAGLPLDFQTHVARAVGDALRDKAAGTLLAAHTAQQTRKRKLMMTPVPVGLGTLAVAGAALTLSLLSQNRYDGQTSADTGQPTHAVSAVAVKAASPIRNVHVKTWTLNAKGDLSLEEEMWYEDSRWRKEGTYGSRLIVGGAGYPHLNADPQKTVYGTYYRYDAAKQQVVSMQEMGEQRTDFTLAHILPPDPYRTARVNGVGEIDGQSVAEYQMKSGATRLRVWVSIDTGLPVRQERAASTGNGKSASWKTIYREDYEFNKPLDESLFDSHTLKDEGWKG